MGDLMCGAILDHFDVIALLQKANAKLKAGLTAADDCDAFHSVSPVGFAVRQSMRRGMAGVFPSGPMVV